MSRHSLKSVLAKHRHYVMALDNVVGVGVGLKQTDGQLTKKMAVTVLVSKKVAPTMLKKTQAVPRLLERDAETDVIEIGEVALLTDDNQQIPRRGRCRPAPGGVTIGHYLVSAGTLGGMVKTRGEEIHLVLSNNHVLANLSDGRDNRATIGDLILQPGTYDGGADPDDAFALLYRFAPLHRSASKLSCPIASNTERAVNTMLSLLGKGYEMQLRPRGSVNLIDAACAKPINEPDAVPDIIGLGIPTGVSEAELGREIIKSGRTTGITTAEVRIIDASIRVSLPQGESTILADQIVTGPMAQPGDSGSLGMTEDKRVVGLLCAGSRQATMYCQIDHVLRALAVELVT